MQPVTIDDHRDKYWHRYTNFKFAAGCNTALIVAAEIPRAALAMPLAFIRQDEKYILCAVLSPTPGENIFVAPNGRWLGGYIPASVRSYPFKLDINADKKEILCVEESSGLILADKGDGAALFDGSGDFSEPVQQVQVFLRQMEKSRLLTQQALSMLAQADLFSEWVLKTNAKGEERLSTGLYKIDETRLSNLSDPSFLQLRNTGALKIAYAQLLSMGNIMKLAQLSRMHKKNTPTASAGPFSLGDDDIFRFGEGGD